MPNFNSIPRNRFSKRILGRKKIKKINIGSELVAILTATWFQKAFTPKLKTETSINFFNSISKLR